MVLEELSFEVLLGAIGKKLDNQITFKLTFPEGKDPKPGPGLDTLTFGYWLDKNKVLKTVKFPQGKFIIQTGPDTEYIVPRGKNITKDNNTVITNPISFADVVSEDTGLGGLKPPSNFPEDELFKLGYVKNDEGEFVKP